MGTFIEIHLAGRKHLQATHQGITIDVYAGDPPGGDPGVPRVLVQAEAEVTPEDDAPAGAEGPSKFHIPTDLPSPLNATRVDPVWESEASDEPENA